MTGRAIAGCLLLLAMSCRQPSGQPATAQSASAGPTVQAEVYTFSTTTHPNRKQWVSAVVVAGGKARLTDELDRWRLFDFEKNSVTFVDDVKKTFRTETLQQLVRSRSASERQKMPPDFPRITLARGGEQQISGQATSEFVVEVGAFRRQLWISRAPFIHERLFPLMILSEPIGGPYPAAMASLYRSLAGVRGFPLAEKTTVSYGKKETVIERRLARVDRKPVPESLLTVPDDYTDTTPVTTPAAGRPSASSPRAGRSARATE